MSEERIELFVKIACIQTEVKLKDKEANMAIVISLMEEASTNGANLIVLPELFNTGYTFNNRTEITSLAEPIPEGRTVQELIDYAKEKNIYIVGSLPEREGIDLYNTSVLVGPNGYIGKYRKTHLCGDEIYWFESGNLGYPVFHTEIGRIAMIICLDGYYPETYRICALQKADLICIPTNWAHCDHLPAPWHTMGPTLTMANALSNHIFVAACSRVGQEPGISYAGHSLVASPTGAPISTIAGKNQQIIYAECNLADTRNRYLDKTNSRLANRRTDLYGEFLGYSTN
ncbi:Predicted amidohydrolase [Dethiosulfatibacter aminovorans DSM 17477]|uniref:Predicted amidohydrolase n=1 Tax=Dethiosulfatibacter aminovorans DSM 17477 TaxID=1121476 RepID=A0A1M6N3C6_9FIRM|nr:nitrilase-related carbon-nitrogen hydrolase [Dethiosulfatibacter aminovorans]SHJ90187.1 Predicted amidohydrolase [Dethiosulfatibacter aminovorans DSM 17477]